MEAYRKIKKQRRVPIAKPLLEAAILQWAGPANFSLYASLMIETPGTSCNKLAALSGIQGNQTALLDLHFLFMLSLFYSIMFY
jgi:hypothetical protein